MTPNQTSALTASSSDATAALPVDQTQTLPRLADFNLGDRTSRISPAVFGGCLRLAEFAGLALVGFAIAVLYIADPRVLASTQYVVAIAGTSLLAVALFEASHLYQQKSFTVLLPNVHRLIFGWSVAIATLIASVFFLKLGPEFSRGWLAYWFAGGIAGVLAIRATAVSLAQSWANEGRLNRRAVILGAGDACNELISKFEDDPQIDIKICGIFDDRGDERSPDSVNGYPKHGDVDRLVEFARNTRIDTVIVTLPISAEDRLLSIMKKLSVLPADIRLAVNASKLRFRPRAYSYLGRIPMIDMLDKPISDWGAIAKAALDKSVALLALIALAPVMAAVAIAIRMESRGPILFRQKRYGFNNELIEVLKFRSMYTDMCDATATKLVTKDDPRVTPIGRFIRKTSIDELPQLFNVLSGELSLVGPRPHAVHAKAADRLYDEAVEGYFARHRVKPGITGWAQINGWRGETDTAEKIEKRVEYDLYYIENWSLVFDLFILARTPLALLKSENAY